MHNITLNGINNMLEDYYGITITQHMLDVIVSELDDSFDETDKSIRDTSIRDVIINVICRHTNIISWPTYGDKYGLKEWNQSFAASGTTDVILSNDWKFVVNKDVE